MQPQFCTSCGAPLQEGNKFCRKCGAKVQLLPEPVAVPVKAPEPAVPAREDLHERKEPAPKQEKPAQPKPETQPQPKPEAQPQPKPEKPVQPKPQPEPVPDQQPKARQEKPKRHRRHPVCTVLVFILCILLFVSAMAGAVLFDAVHALSAENVAEILHELVNEEDILDLSASAVDSAVRDEDVTVAEWIAGVISEEFGDGEEVPKRVVKDFFEESTILPFLIEELGETVVDVCRDTNESGLTVEELEKLVADNTALAEDRFGLEIDDETAAGIVDWIVESGVPDVFDADGLYELAPDACRILRMALSYWSAGFFAAMSVLFILLLVICNGWHLGRTARDTGITLTVVGGILATMTAVPVLLPNVWRNFFGAAAPVGTYVKMMLMDGMVCTAAILGAGILLLLVRLIEKLCKPTR